MWLVFGIGVLVGIVLGVAGTLLWLLAQFSR
jgi:hypothetical protein